MKDLLKLVLGIVSLFLVSSGLLYAEVPHLINYQARLTDKAGQPLEGIKAITFRIYDAEAGGNLLWEEIQNVNMQSGIFNVMLGGVTSLNLAFDKPYFLEIKVESEVMSPRQRIASVGYVMRAQTADSLPDDVILMCKGDCPVGYRKIGALDGKFLAGGSSYNANAGGSNTHTHGGGSYTAPSHTHKGTVDANTHFAYVWAGGETRGTHPEHKHSFTTEVDGGGAISGISGTGDSRPEFATVVLCEKE